ncbi:Nuclear transport factor 2, eukaryote,NTF2-like domain [Cinara cedri]|uniref:Nuclear transport factor 2, eukaryote,NTF2-like domain n=1 Tax=Cinara cedri TaxID=506608 RepID=A0A5E4NNI4_9HEMI|nr:Nuclear transport factor 2, eukaryote,NTF2-like domain [Cinara cedri]
MENGSEVVDPKCEISYDSRAVTTVNQDPSSCTTKAARIGYVFSHLYFSVLRSSPEYADDFYDVDGEFRTIYADGSTVVAKTRNHVKSVLMRPTSESEYVIKSVFAMPCRGPSDGLLVNISGDQFTQTFIVEHRPERTLGYAIVGSLIRYVSAVPLADHQTPVTRFDASNCPAITGSTSSVSLETLDNCSPNTAASDNPIPGNVSNDIAINDTVSEKTADIKSVQEPVISLTHNNDIEPASTNTANENKEHKPFTDKENIKKHICNLVLFSAACWVVYRYIL